MGICEPDDGPRQQDFRKPVGRGSGDPQLPGGDGWLLGLYRYRRCHPHAGGAVFPPAGLFALRGGHAVPVLRVLRHCYQPGRWLAGGAHRTESHHAYRYGVAGGGAIAAYRARCLVVGALCHGCPGVVGYRQGPEQDVGQGERQDAGREWRRVEAVPLGSRIDRFQECPQGWRLFHRCGTTGMDRFPRCPGGAGG